MFYKNLELPIDSFDKDVFLIQNFLNITPTYLGAITDDLFDLNADFLDRIEINIMEIVRSTFDKLIIAQRDLKIDVLLSAKASYANLAQNGLTGIDLYTKLKVLDWFAEKWQNFFASIRSGLNLDFVQGLLNQIKSVLSSLLKALGINPDIFEECIDLLLSLTVMSNEQYQVQ